MKFENVEHFEPMSGDDLECIDATSSDSLMTELTQTALFYRQEAMDKQDEVEHLVTALKEAAKALESAGFTFSADKAWKVISIYSYNSV